jgi:hypothetical protein
MQPSGSPASPPRPTLSWNRLLVQSSPPDRYRGHWFRDPIAPLAFPRPYGLPAPDVAESLSKKAANPLFEFRLPPESFPVAPSPPRCRDNVACPSPGLWFPSAHSRLGGPLTAGLPHPLRSAFRVWFPSWRFTPPGPAPALFRADSAPGIRPFGASPSRKVSRVFPRAMNPPAISLAVVPSDESSGRPGKPWLLGFDPPGSPLPPVARLTPARLDAPLGFDLSRATHRTPRRRSRAGSSHALGPMQ